MPFYPEKIDRRFAKLNFVGDLSNSNVTEQNASFICGAVVRISLEIEDKKIVAARFKAVGCGYLMAAADVLCEKVIDHSPKDFEEILARNPMQLSASIENELEKFPASKIHCLELLIETFESIVRNFQSAQKTVWNGEDALICVCFGVSERTIAQVIEQNNLGEVSLVTKLCNAGGGCGSCQPLIQEILDDIQLKKEKNFR